MATKRDIFRTKTREELIDKYYKDKENQEKQRTEVVKTPEELKKSSEKKIIIIGPIALIIELFWLIWSLYLYFFLGYILFLVFSLLAVFSTIFGILAAYQWIDAEYEKRKDYDQMNALLGNLEEEIRILKQRIDQLEKMYK